MNICADHFLLGTVFSGTVLSGTIGPRALAGALIGVMAGAWLFYRGFQLLQRKRLLENIPASKIRSAAMGLVEVNGLATGPHTISAPITHVPCFYYRSIAWQMKKTSNSERWEKLADDSMHVPFYVDDGTGKLLIDPQGAEMEIHRDFCETYNNSLFPFSFGVPPNVGGFLTRHGISCDKKIKVEEYCVKPKNALFVLGSLTNNHGVNVSATPIRSLLSEVPQPPAEEPVQLKQLLSRLPGNDEPNAGTESPEVIRLSGNEAPTQSSEMTQQEKVAAALVKARLSSRVRATGSPTAKASSATVWFAGAASAVAARQAPEPFDLQPGVVLAKGAQDKPFFISWRSQRDIVRSLGWKSALMIWGGPLLTLFSAYIILAECGWL